MNYININNLIIRDDNHAQLCKKMFKVLNCNLLWVMKVEGGILKMLTTDQPILEYYWDEKYYLHDPSLENKPNNDYTSWKITLGTNCEDFYKGGFFNDLYKMFNITEFVSIEKSIGTACYCFRFFTWNNRFVFMNKLLNDLPIVKCFINAMIEKLKGDLDAQLGIKLTNQ